MKRSDKLAIKEQRAWELFQKHFRLAMRAWRAYESLGKRAERAGRKEAEAEFDLDKLKQDALATQPWPTKRRR